MSTVIIIHGTDGYPQENWFPWLKRELETLHHTVIVPQFPTGDAQTLDSWWNELGTHHLPKDTIFIGHSLGVTFLLTVLERRPAKAAFLVSGFVGKLGSDFDILTHTFAQKSFDWEKIRAHCEHITIFHSDNDPYVALEKAEYLAKHLHTPIHLIPDGGHLNSKAGYREFPALLEAIKPLL